MIDAREIRIGNIIDFEDGSTDRVRVDGLFQIEDTWFVNWTKVSGNGGFDRGDSILEDFKPIPLTPDILDKAGFKNNILLLGERGVCSLGWHLMSNTYKGETIVNLRYDYDDCAYYSHNSEHQTEIKHLHQLQNIFWCLVGEELVIEL